jgi:solute carrier family 35 (UDP-xylose/UDP-N-acetylglucosamine transporter), member B4
VSVLSIVIRTKFVSYASASNAITLEQLTSEYPHSGSLITFLQFIIISLYGLPKQITFSQSNAHAVHPWLPIPRLKPRKIHLASYLVQVALFYLISILNNAAFGYHIPMAVHIIFRSGGLIISMLLGWTIAKKRCVSFQFQVILNLIHIIRYTIMQISSVILVTFGVILTTLSVQRPQTSYISHTIITTHSYRNGIAILFLALLLSGFLGLVQDWTYTGYGRPEVSNPKPSAGAQHHNHVKPSGERGDDVATDKLPSWQESMFYLHFLALPMFIFVRHDLAMQLRAINASPTIHLSLPSSFSTLLWPLRRIVSFAEHPLLALPHAYIPLLLNTLTQLLCVAGVHRLTTRVSALTVTLTLVVRKATSFVLSVVWLGGGARTEGGGLGQMWLGAALVMIGTVGYSIANGARTKGKSVVTRNGTRRIADTRKGKAD